MNFQDKENLTSFLLEIQKLQMKLESTVKEYGYEDSIISLSLCGVVVEEDGEDHLKAIYGYNIPNLDTLEDILEFIRDSYGPDDSDDLNDMLNDLGISMN